MRGSGWAAIVGALAIGSAACTRHADLVDEPDVVSVSTPTLPEAGDLPALDSGLRSDAYAACGDRGQGTCRGPVDFPCDFNRWVETTATKCQQATGCRTNGYLRVKLGDDGCVDEIGMDRPNDAILTCLLAEFGAVRCPCLAIEHTYFFGLGNGIGASIDGGVCPGPHG